VFCIILEKARPRVLEMLAELPVNKMLCE
jgi:hypothetical protein